jgi:hypothetical protein
LTIYRYAWRNNSKRAKMYGRQCIVLHRLSMNSVIIQFIDNGQRECVSRNALRKVR